jgi:hypothetical protein
MQPNTADKRKLVTRGLHRRVTVPASRVARCRAFASDISAWHRHLTTDDLPRAGVRVVQGSGLGAASSCR